jgi:hypothetical protein
MHFFSRPRYEKGISWYEQHFSNCDAKKKKGEFSTSYLYRTEAPVRIKQHYPDVQLIAILRNPVTRAVSQYKNAIKAGEITKDETFDSYCARTPSVIEQGYYFKQLSAYYEHFSREQVLVLIYEDSKKDPEAFIKKIYSFLGVADTFVPAMLHSEINIARVPRMIFLERAMHHTAEWMRRVGLDTIVHTVRSLGLPDLMRSANTEKPAESEVIDVSKLRHYFLADTKKLGELLKRDLVVEWNLDQSR